MEIYDAMRTTFAAREFTDEPLPDATLYQILDAARFAPSGGNRQGWRVIVVRDRRTREALAELSAPAAKRYAAQQQAGESPWNSVDPTAVDAATIERTPAPARLTEPFVRARVVLVVCVDLKVVAATDQLLDRVGIVGGASIYPFAWNILLAARQEGFAGTITTLGVWPRNRSSSSSWAFPGTSRSARPCRSDGRSRRSRGSRARPSRSSPCASAGAAPLTAA